MNHAGLLQRTERAVRPPGQARCEGRIFWELAGRSRLYLAEEILKELAGEAPYFEACAQAAVPEQGLRLGVP